MKTLIPITTTALNMGGGYQSQRPGPAMWAMVPGTSLVPWSGAGPWGLCSCCCCVCTAAPEGTHQTSHWWARLQYSKSWASCWMPRRTSGMRCSRFWWDIPLHVPGFPIARRQRHWPLASLQLYLPWEEESHVHVKLQFTVCNYKNFPGGIRPLGCKETFSLIHGEWPGPGHSAPVALVPQGASTPQCLLGLTLIPASFSWLPSAEKKKRQKQEWSRCGMMEGMCD